LKRLSSIGVATLTTVWLLLWLRKLVREG